MFLGLRITSACTYGTTWLHIWTRNIHDVNVTGNFADTRAQWDSGTRACSVTNTIVYVPGNRTVAALAVVEASGPAKSASQNPGETPVDRWVTYRTEDSRDF